MMVMVANSSGFKTGYIAGRYPGMLGHLYSPGAQRGPWKEMPYALDNDCYPCWSKGRVWSRPKWIALLEWAKRSGQLPAWSLVKDVVTNREATLEAWKEESPTVRSYGFRPAFAIQNGMTFADVPDSECVLFLGGTTDWKEKMIDPWCAQFPGRVHVGRVNAWDRLIRCYEAGAISVDGTRWFQKESYKDRGQIDDLIRFLELQTQKRAA